MDTEKNTAATVAAEDTEQTTEKKKQDPEKLFPLRLSKFETFYILAVAISCVGLGVGIFVAVMRDLFWGAVIAAAAVFVYVYFVPSELHEKLGIWYTTNAGTLAVTKCRARYGDVLYIPSRLLWYDVEELRDNAFFAPSGKNAKLRAIYLPRSLKKIGKDAFASCEELTTIYFEGSREEWDAIEKESDTEDLEIIFSAELPKNKGKK